MESLFGCKFFLVLLGLLSNANADDPVLQLQMEPEMVKAGDNVIFRCGATNFNMIQFVRWSKVVVKDNMPVTYNVATNGQIEDGFKMPGSRYSADFEQSDDKNVQFRLYISNVRNEDGGVYKCSMGDTVTEMDLLVYEAPSKISMTITRNGTDRMVQDGEHIKFEDGSSVSIKCEVEGSNPEPEVYLRLGAGVLEDVQLFPNNQIENVQGDALGQVRSTWHVTAKANDFMISHENAADQELSCEAKVGVDMSLKTSLVVEMEGRPPVFQCDAVDQMARVEDTNVILQCTAKATPPVESGNVYYFTKDNTKVTLEPDNYDKDYEVFIETEDASSETTMRLIIGRVEPQMFRNYTFYVYNTVGHAEHTIELYKDPTQKYVAEEPSASVNVLSSFLVILISSILHYLL